MSPIRTVLCPIDFTGVTETTLRLAVRICRQTGARLVLHHNLGPAPPDFLGVHWMWEEEHGPSGPQGERTLAQRLDKVFATLPEDLEYEAKVSRGPLEDGVLYLARELPADLVILGSHGTSSAEHRSVTDHIVLRAPCSVLATAESLDPATVIPSTGSAETRPIVVATDLTGHDRGAVAFAFELAAALPYEVHLVHVLRKGPRLTEGKRISAERDARARLAELVPGELEGRARLHVRLGSPATEILAAASEIDALFLLLGARKHGLLYRTFTGLTSLEVLHGSRWPVWFVPAGRASRRLSFEAAWTGERMNWKEAKERTIAQWEGIRAGLGRELPVDLVAEVNAVAELCIKAREAAGEPAARCRFCIAFADVGGCARVNLQITEALLTEDWERAGRYIDEVLELLRAAPIPGPPVARTS